MITATHPSYEPSSRIYYMLALQQTDRSSRLERNIAKAEALPIQFMSDITETKCERLKRGNQCKSSLCPGLN